MLRIEGAGRTMTGGIDTSNSLGPSRIVDADTTSGSDGAQFIYIPGSGPVVIDSSELMFKGEYGRSGPDLVITGSDGQRFVVVGFFSSPNPPALISGDGGVLSGDLVAKLAGPRFSGQFAQAAPAAGATPVGQVEAIGGVVSARRADGTAVVLQMGTAIYQGDVIETGVGANVNIAFVDRTILTLSESARMVVDRYVFSPAASNNASLFNLVQGTFVFLAGQIAPTGDMRIETPVATMGIRGTTGVVEVAANNGATNYTLVPDPDGRTGQFDVFNKATGQLLFSATRANESLLVRTAAGDFQQTVKLPDQLVTQQQAIGLAFSVFNNVQARVQSGQPVVAPTNTGTPAPPGAAPGAVPGAAPGTTPGTAPTTPPPATPGTTPETAPGGTAPAAPTEQRGGEAPAPDQTQTAQQGSPLPDLSTGNTTADLLGNITSSTTGATGADQGASSLVSLLTDTTQANTTSGTTEAPPPVVTPIVVDTSPANTPPSISIPSVIPTVNEDGSVTITGFTVSDPNGGVVTTSINALSTVTLASTAGLTFLIGDGVADEVMVFTGSPADVEAALNGLTYIASTNNDQSGGITISLNDGIDIVTASISVPITASPDLPVGTDDVATGGPGGVSPTSVLANDIDPDSGETALLVVSAVNGSPANVGLPVALASGSTVTLLANGTFSINPAASLGNGATAVDTFSYTVQDPTGRTDDATVSITISGANDAPTASPISHTVGEDDTISVDLIAAASAADADGPTTPPTVTGLPATIVTTRGQMLASGTHFTVSGTSFVLTVAGLALFNGMAAAESDSFVVPYSVSDGILSTPNTLSVTVNGANDAPVVANPIADAAVAVGSALTHVVPANAFADADISDTLTFDATLPGENPLPAWLSFNASTRTFSGTPGVGDRGTITVEVIASDGTASVTDTITITVGPNIVGDANANTLIGTPGADYIFADAGNDLILPDAGDDVVDGGADTDTVVYAAATLAVTVNLAAGTATGSEIGTDTLIGIENAITGSGNDTLTGDANANRLEGGAGSNVYVGGAGDDNFIGGTGFDIRTDGDTADYSGVPEAINATLTGAFGTIDSFVVGGPSFGFDMLQQVESVVGTNFDDIFNADISFESKFLNDDGTNANHSIFNQFRGGGGNDTVTGNGATRVNYGDANGAVTVNLATGTGAGSAGGATNIGIDTFTLLSGVGGINGVTQIAGSAFNDTLIGSDGSWFEQFRGLAGNDTIDGGGGIEDQVDYRNSPGAVVVNLTTGTASDGFGGTDTLSNIERARGSEFNDTITGSAVDNNLFGRDGDDTLIGAAGGFDIYSGGRGNDTLIGTAVLLNPALDGDRATYLEADVTGGITVTIGTASGPANNSGLVVGDASVGTDTLTSIEQVFGTRFADTYTAFANFNDGSFGSFNAFEGGAGDDQITGNGNTRVGYRTALSGVLVDLDFNNDGIANDGFADSILPADAAGIGQDDFFGGVIDVEGSEFADQLTGSNDAAVVERFRGRGGNDVIDGQGGTDEADYRFGPGPNGITVVMTATAGVADVTNDGAGGQDELIGIERIRGSFFADNITMDGLDNRVRGEAGNDQIFGGAGNDQLEGGDGDDNLHGQANNDSLIGGDGFDFFQPGGGTDTVNGTPVVSLDQAYDDRDRVSYSEGGAGVIVNLSNVAITVGPNTVNPGRALDYTGATDTLIDIERVRGTNFVDHIQGSSTANLRQEIFEGLSGNDTIDGGAGRDVASYERDAVSGGAAGGIINLAGDGGFITVDIGAGPTVVFDGTAKDGFGTFDTLFNIDSARGTDSTDYFNGGEERNVFRPLGGNDTFVGGDDPMTDFGDQDMVDMYVGDIFTGPGAVVELGLGTATRVSGGSLTLSGIEDAAGSESDDVIFGSADHNYLSGRAGDDTIAGGAGDDLIEGGPGFNVLDGGAGTDDAVIYAFDPAEGRYYNLQFPTEFPTVWTGVFVSLATGTAANYAGGTDTLAGFENVIGTFYNDQLTGDSGDNGFAGLAGNDTIDGGLGNDLVYYGVLDYDGRNAVNIDGINASIPNGVVVDLVSQVATADGHGGSDTLSSIEGVVGSIGVDTITGDGNDNFIEGGAGGDTLVGAGGIDTLSYEDSGAGTLIGVNINLQTNTASGADAQGDIISGFENVIGSGNADTITGSTADNVIEGGNGGDTLTGGGGIDTLSYESSFFGVTVNLQTGATANGHAQGDVISGFRNIFGSDDADSLTGDTNANRLEGRGGNDVLSDSDALFTLIDGGTGQDTLRFVLDGGVLLYDLTMVPDGNVQGTERIFLEGDGSGFAPITLRLNADDVINMSTEVNTDFLANIGALQHNATDNAIIGGNPFDVVELVDGDVGGAGTWQTPGSITVGAESLVVWNYVNGASVLASVAIENDVTVTPNA